MLNGADEPAFVSIVKARASAIRSYVRSVKRGGSKERVAPGKLLQNL